MILAAVFIPLNHFFCNIGGSALHVKDCNIDSSFVSLLNKPLLIVLPLTQTLKYFCNRYCTLDITCILQSLELTLFRFALVLVVVQFSRTDSQLTVCRRSHSDF